MTRSQKFFRRFMDKWFVTLSNQEDKRRRKYNSGVFSSAIVRRQYFWWLLCAEIKITSQYRGLRSRVLECFRKDNWRHFESITDASIKHAMIVPILLIISNIFLSNSFPNEGEYNFKSSLSSLPQHKCNVRAPIDDKSILRPESMSREEI